MYSKNLLPALSFLLFSCNLQGNSANDTDRIKRSPVEQSNNNPYASVSAIPLPEGYSRLAAGNHSFTAWLSKITLKKDKTVYLFNGNKKQNQSAQFAVLNISTGDKDLQQCADAVMRLRAEYLFETTQFAAIVFRDNEHTAYTFSPPYTKEHLQRYLLTVFGMCGSASLSKQLHVKNIHDILPGDVFIHGGFPGHAEMVMDVAVNKEGKKIFLLAQSYMPAQDIHILVNPRNKILSPWYELQEDIITPEYVFGAGELKTW